MCAFVAGKSLDFACCDALATLRCRRCVLAFRCSCSRCWFSSVSHEPRTAPHLSCIDSRTPAELIFDLGIGDVFVIRIAGNIARDKVLGSMEFGTLLAGAKLILVLGHTSCGAVKAAVDLAQKGQTAEQAMGCTHLDVLVSEIQRAIDPELPLPVATGSHNGLRESYVDEVARRNVQRTMAVIRQQSGALDGLVREGKLAIVGGLYDVRTGEVNFFALDGAISESVLAECERPGHKRHTPPRHSAASGSSGCELTSGAVCTTTQVPP